jgi:hypothetical protein
LADNGVGPSGPTPWIHDADCPDYRTRSASVVDVRFERIRADAASPDGKLAWAFREPIATLLLDGKTVGRHYTGPNWEHIDSSAVVGKAVGNAPGATANDIPWLKLTVTSGRGTGILSGVTTVQRINTVGGKLEGTCDKAGSYRNAPYSADYVFLRKS